jgi:hypothetical protein
MDTLNAQISNAVVNRINSGETIQQNIAIKMMKETMTSQKEMTKKLLEGGEKVEPKSSNSTFEYVA